LTRLALTIFAREDILAFLLGADDPRCDPHHSKLNNSALMYRRVVYGAGDTMARGVSGNIQLSRTRRDLDEIGGIRSPPAEKFSTMFATKQLRFFGR
jgi:hypothetical protein